MLTKRDLANAPAGARLILPALELKPIDGRPVTIPSQEYAKTDSGHWLMVAYGGKPRSYKRPTPYNTFDVDSCKDLKGFTLIK